MNKLHKFDLKKDIGAGDTYVEIKPKIIRLKKSNDKIVVELSRKELKKMCESCASKCRQIDFELVDCNLISARKIKILTKI